MSLFLCRILGVCAAALLVGAIWTPASAQFVEPDVSKAHVRLGPVMLNPTIDLKNLGIDTNVFNDPAGHERSDFTFTLTPQTELWMRAGRTWMIGHLREDIVWYNTYAGERAGNLGYTLSWLAPLNHLNFSATTSFLSARDRPGYEIDTRVQRKELALKGAAELRVLSKTFFGVRGSQETIDFDSTAAFLGASLRQELNRTITGGAVTLRHQLTPLTSITFDAGRSEDRFEFSSPRDSNSTVAGVEITFDPFALIKGSARFGYRDFEPLARDVPSYRGTTAAVDLSYVLLGTTRFGVQAGRDVSYSYDLGQPYYLQSGVQATLMQQIFGPIDAVGRAGVQTLAYRERVGVSVEAPDRKDVVHSYGGGVGYHPSDAVRIGVNVDRQRRASELAQHRFDALKVGLTVTYGF